MNNELENWPGHFEVIFRGQRLRTDQETQDNLQLFQSPRIMIRTSCSHHHDFLFLQTMGLAQLCSISVSQLSVTVISRQPKFGTSIFVSYFFD